MSGCNQAFTSQQQINAQEQSGQHGQGSQGGFAPEHYEDEETTTEPDNRMDRSLQLEVEKKKNVLTIIYLDYPLILCLN